MGRRADDRSGAILPQEDFLQNRDFNIWECYSAFESSYNDRLHFHNFYELSVIYEGTSRFLVNGAVFEMCAGSMQLIRPADYHRQLTRESEHIRYYNLMFSPAFLSPSLLDALEQTRAPLCVHAVDEDGRALLRMAARMHAEFTARPDDALSLVWLRGAVESICIYLLRNAGSESGARPEIPQEAVRRAVVYVQSHYRQPIRLADAAEAAALSPSYFSRLFHDVMGVPFSRYLTAYRLQEAERLLRAGDLPVQQLAAACGFASSTHFVTAFKARYGLPPAVWRARHRER